jgi:mono/diheme cytochrome c family protein
MNTRSSYPPAFPFAALLLACAVHSSPAAEDAASSPAFFESKIRPLLLKHCTECHGEKKQKGELRLDLKAAAFKGGETGAAIVAGDSGKSPLLQRILSDESDEKMPPKGERLSRDEIALLKTWIENGAVWPESEADKAALVDNRLQHWAFQPVRVSPPKTSIDAFLGAKLHERGLAFSPEADRPTLIRRVSLDLTGLLPSPEAIEAFEHDTAPAAYENLVERLLGSERFGEKWARHWLDVVRFAESDGFEKNDARANAWPYRDYVIEAFNRDKPFDQFVREQLAGDTLGADAATGFLVGGAVDRVKSKDPVLTANQRADELHDMVSTTAATFLGLTVNCARCHDHKFDPISARDYYAMTAMLQGVQHGERPLRTAQTEAYQKKAAELRQQIGPIEASLGKIQPLAHLNRTLLIDDSANPSASGRPGVTQIEQPINGEPLVYSPGKERGQAGDPGDLTRLPNLGRGYRYWKPGAGSGENLFSWDPKLTGRYRIWLSWGAGTPHTKDAVYMLDRDGDLSTTDDQTRIALVNQSGFADGTAVAGEQKRWSGFSLAGEYDLNPASVVLLRGGPKGGVHTADVVAFEEVVAGAKAGTQPPLRAPVTPLVNEDRFEPVNAKYLRFSIHKSTNTQPCIDELEVYGGSQGTKNVASAQYGTRVSASGTFANGSDPKHQLSHLNDGRYGNDFSWISSQKDGGWVQLEFAKPEEIRRVVWSRDRTTDPKVRPYEDRLVLGYRIEVSLNGQEWTLVASSADRLETTYRTQVPSIPTVSDLSAAQLQEFAGLNSKRLQLQNEIKNLTRKTLAYVGTFREPGPTHRNFRGDPTQPREEVAPGALARIGPTLALEAETPEKERRAALAEWMVDPKNPLTARVIVNRLWHYHFGTGLVDTPSDFGINGSRPTHPELLDWLASELVAHGWSLKYIHRLILHSAAYRQKSDSRETALQVDSSTRLLWRFPPRRMEAEAVRDSILEVSGKLDLRAGGPGFDLFVPNTNYVKVYVTRTEYGPEEFRRMVYQSKPRSMLDDLFGAFDCPDAGQPAPKRNSSTTPLQALNLLNSHFALQQSGFFAERLQKEAGAEPNAQVRRAFQLVFGRVPSSEELADSVSLVTQHGLPMLCRALFNSNEFIRLH